MNHFPKIKKIKVLSPTDKVREAIGLMDSLEARDLPCLDGKHFTGVFRREHLADSPVEASLHEIPAQITVACKNEFLFQELWSYLCSFKPSFIPIENQEGIYQGCISAEDLIAWFHQNFCLDSQTGYLIVLHMERRDYSLARLSTLAEENNLLIESSMIVFAGEGEELFVTLKTNSGNIERWLETLDRQAIEVAAVWGSGVQEDKWKERLNEFMHYLNV